MIKEEKAKYILNKVDEIFPDSESELVNWNSAFQFLVCVILSAQATDKGVNKVTAQLFEKYPTSKELSIANLEDVKKLIKSLNFFNNKAKHIVSMAQKVESDFGGVVPSSLENLVKLPGVGYKTANVVLAEYFGINCGVAVDTHVWRVVSRLGLVSKEAQKEATKVAKELEKLYESKDWGKINSEYVLFGRYICKAKNPKCKECPFTQICSYYKKENDVKD